MGITAKLRTSNRVMLTDELRGSIPLQATNGLVVQLVRISACHAEGREFESRPDR